MESSSLVFDPQAGIKKYFGAYINIIIVKRTYDISISFFAHILTSFMNYRFKLTTILMWSL